MRSRKVPSSRLQRTACATAHDAHRCACRLRLDVTGSTGRGAKVLHKRKDVEGPNANNFSGSYKKANATARNHMKGHPFISHPKMGFRWTTTGAWTGGPRLGMAPTGRFNREGYRQLQLMANNQKSAMDTGDRRLPYGRLYNAKNKKAASFRSSI